MANEKRLDLIDRGALLEAIDESDRENFHNGVANRSIHHYEHVHFMKMVLNAPTMDAVEVVRCKDCRWAEDIESSLLREVFVSGVKNCIIKRGDDAYGRDCSVVSPNDFCSDGERKDNERKAD